ncbi:MAG: proton-conducting transporter membrane subunit [Clostridia bacterium]|nr:proton-conducting transporter membrane subunit [Clostridia bacterium]
MPLYYLAIPLIAVIALNLAFKEMGKKISFWVTAAVALLQMGLSVAAVILCAQTGSALKGQFFTSISIDFLSAVVLLTIGLIAFVSIVMARVMDRENIFNFANLLLLCMLGMNGITMVTDLFSLYVFIEVTSAASFILIAIHRDKAELEGSFKYYMLSAIATVLMLTAIAFIFMLAGDTGFGAVRKYIDGLGGAFPFQIVIAFMLFTAGLSIKAGLVPFHGWVPDAYSASSSPVSVLLAGIVTKVSGVYTLMRVYRDVFGSSPAVGHVLMILGLLSIFIGALAAIGQKDFKRMLAYSSISQIGYIIIGIATGSPLGFIGALLHFFNHADFKSLLFVDSAAIEMQTGKRDMNEMGGLASKMPSTGASSILAFLSTAGIPPLSGFWSKFMIILAVWAVSKAAASLALLASLITLAYFLVMQRKVFFGKTAEGMQDVKEAPRGIVAVEWLLSAITVILGVLFPLVLIYLKGIGLI